MGPKQKQIEHLKYIIWRLMNAPPPFGERQWEYSRRTRELANAALGDFEAPHPHGG